MLHPVIRLKALTAEAVEVLGDRYLQIERLPFLVGRESRRNVNSRAFYNQERRLQRESPTNDLYIREDSPFHNISREHFLIDFSQDELVLVDRGSVCGTIVEGKSIGGNRAGGECRLQNQDVIIVGTSRSPYVFKILVD